MKRILYIIIILIIFGILFFALNPNQKNTTINENNNSSTTKSLKSFALVVKENKLISGPTVLKANQGDTVIIKITADVDGELHLHGYDKHVDFKKGKQSQISFSANVSGRFPYELEGTKTEIGALEIQPK